MDNASVNKWLILIEEKEAVVGLLTERGTLLVDDQKGWDGEDPDSLIASLDAGIGNCLSKEDGAPKPQKTIFVLPPFWVSNKGEVLPSHKKVLKNVCQQLKLVPEGFLVGEEVLSNFYSDFVSIYFGKEYLRFSVVIDKSLELQEELENGEDIDPEDVSVFLRKLNGKAIIPKELFFWGRIKEGNKDRLLTYPWQNEKVFDSPPQLKVLLWSDFFELIAKVVRGDVQLEVIEDTVKEEIEEKEIKQPKTASTFGFSSSDVAETSRPEPKIDPQPKKPVASQPVPEKELEVEKAKKPSQKPDLKKQLSKIKLPSLAFLNFKFLSQKKAIILVLLPLLILVGLFLGWRFSKATIEIYVTPEELSEEIEVQLDTASNRLDLQAGIIPAEEVTTEKSGQKSQPTTGEKLVGERAEGEVKIFNRTSDEGEFAAGTKLIGPGGLEFSLDSNVSVAPKTADLDTGVDRWGETIAVVSAVEIGPEYNLAENTTFTIEDYSDEDFLARNPDDFEGGTSRQIRAVAEQDIESLRQSLSEDLITQAEEELKSKLADSQIISGSFTTEIIDQTFSAQVGDEVDSLSLELTARVSAARISSERLIEIGKLVLEERVDPEMEIEDGSIRAKFDADEDDQSEVIVGVLTLRGKSYPKIDLVDLSQKVAGKRENQAKELIRNQYPRIYRYHISYQLPFLKFFSYLPSQPGNIIIEVRE